MDDHDSGQVIGVVDGRDSAAVKTWLKTSPAGGDTGSGSWRSTPSAAFRSAVRSWLPKARVSIDHFHLVKLAFRARAGADVGKLGSYVGMRTVA